MEAILQTLFGAVIGAAVSLATTYWLQHQHELKTRKALATALNFRVMEAGNEIVNLLKHLRSSLSKEAGIPQDQLWANVKQLVGLSEKTLEHDVHELSILSKSEHNDLVVRIIELLNARNIAISNMLRYNKIREDIDERIGSIVQFQSESGRMKAKIDIVPDDHPEIMGPIHKANDLVVQLLQLLEESFVEAQTVANDLKKALPSYFPKGTQLKVISFPDIP